MDIATKNHGEHLVLRAMLQDAGAFVESKDSSMTQGYLSDAAAMLYC